MTLVIGAGLMIVCRASSTFGACRPPEYVVAKNESSPLGDVPGYMQVSVSRNDFTLQNLTCLAGVLKGAFYSEHGLTVFLFDNPYAAAAFVPVHPEPTSDVLTSYKYIRCT